MDADSITKFANDRSKNGATAWLIKPDGSQIRVDHEGKLTSEVRLGTKPLGA